jgi:putative Holliday junction resolvase
MSDRAEANGVWVGVDVGSVRVGVAACDADGVLATPVRTVDARSGAAATVTEIVAICDDLGAVAVVVGLPLGMSGEAGEAASRARTLGLALATAMPTRSVYLVDERLTTVDAHRRLRDSGLAGRRQRAVVDQAAAVLILQGALDHLTATGEPAGERVRTTGGRRKPRTKDRR